VWLHRQV